MSWLTTRRKLDRAVTAAYDRGWKAGRASEQAAPTHEQRFRMRLIEQDNLRLTARNTDLERENLDLRVQLDLIRNPDVPTERS